MNTNDDGGDNSDNEILNMFSIPPPAPKPVPIAIPVKLISLPPPPTRRSPIYIPSTPSPPPRASTPPPPPHTPFPSLPTLEPPTADITDIPPPSPVLIAAATSLPPTLPPMLLFPSDDMDAPSSPGPVGYDNFPTELNMSSDRLFAPHHHSPHHIDTNSEILAQQPPSMIPHMPKRIRPATSAIPISPMMVSPTTGDDGNGDNDDDKSITINNGNGDDNSSTNNSRIKRRRLRNSNKKKGLEASHAAAAAAYSISIGEPRPDTVITLPVTTMPVPGQQYILRSDAIKVEVKRSSNVAFHLGIHLDEASFIASGGSCVSNHRMARFLRVPPGTDTGEIAYKFSARVKACGGIPALFARDASSAIREFGDIKTMALALKHAQLIVQSRTL